jgi:hypothetical protein
MILSFFRRKNFNSLKNLIQFSFDSCLSSHLQNWQVYLCKFVNKRIIARMMVLKFIPNSLMHRYRGCSTDYINQIYRHNLLSLLKATSIVSRYCNRLDIVNIDNFQLLVKTFLHFFAHRY